MDIIEALLIIPRSLLSLFILFLVTKLIGKKQVSELSLFDYVIGISIGNFTAEMTMSLDVQFINGVMALLTFGYLHIYITINNEKHKNQTLFYRSTDSYYSKWKDNRKSYEACYD